MSSISLPDIAGRPRPVLIVAGFLAVVQALVATAAIADWLGPDTVGTILALTAVIQVALGAWTHAQVTPLSAPQNAAGKRLVPTRAKK